MFILFFMVDSKNGVKKLSQIINIDHFANSVWVINLLTFQRLNLFIFV